MRCPMRVGTIDHEDEDCIKQECAWWRDNTLNCSILQLSKDIAYIAQVVTWNGRR